MLYYFAAFFIITCIYARVSIQRKNLLNILVFSYWTYGILMTLLYGIRLGLSGNYFGITKGDVITLTYFLLYFLIAALIEKKAKPLKLPNMTKRTSPNNVVLYLCIIIVGRFWLRNLDIIRQAIVNPRMFYANTRIGGGIIYYVVVPVSLLIYYIIISRLDYTHKRRKSTIIAVVISVFMFAYLYMFGQKAVMFNMVFLFLSTYYFRNKQSGFKVNKRIIKYIAIAGVALLFVTSVYFRQQNILSNSLLSRIVSYADYLRNFNDLVNYLPHHFYGQIFIEDEFLSLIPRALWPSKPELFGSLSLGLYVPRLVSWVLAKTGAPSFGYLGQGYADFGIFGVGLKLFIELLFLWIARTYELKLQKKRYNFFHHWLMLTFAGLRIFSITLTTFPIYQVVIIFLVYQLSKTKIPTLKIK